MSAQAIDSADLRACAGGGTASVCRVCSKRFELLGWQITIRDYRCLQCKRDQQNAANAKKGDSLRAEARASYHRCKEHYAAYWAAKRDDPIHRQKRAARRKVSTEIEAGRLTRGSCELCGLTKTDAHHHDYAQPLAIRWLCRRCHFKEEGHGRTRHV